MRSDSWAAKLPPEQQVTLYQKARQDGAWAAIRWAAAELKLDKKPSQTSFYRWMRTMRAAELQQRMEEVAAAAIEAAALGEKTSSDEKIVAALKARIIEAALAGKTREAAELTRIADTLHGQLMKEKALALAERRLQVLERTKVGEEKKLRDELEAAQGKLKEEKKVPLVTIFGTPDGLPPVRKIQGDAETATDQPEPPMQESTVSLQIPPPTPPSGTL